MTTIDDALKGMTRKQLEELRERVELELQSCVLCGSEGAASYHVRGGRAAKGAMAAMLFCKPCFEKYRLPETRVTE